MNAKQMHGTERKFPAKRYATYMLITGAAVASLFWLRSCNKPLPETIIIDPAVKTACGCYGADTTGRDSSGVRHVFVRQKQGCYPSATNYDSSCGCAEKKPAVKKAAKPRKKAAVAVTTLGACEAAPVGPLATGVEATINMGLDAKAGELRRALVNGDSRNIQIHAKLTIKEGIILSQDITAQCAGGCGTSKVTIADMTGINVVTRRVEAVGKKCVYDYVTTLK